jgi:hypothetical protein
VGQAAHIVAKKVRGPRGAVALDDGRDLNRYENLVLLCAHHHAIVDRQVRTHSVEDLRTWKAEHEAWVDGATAGVPRDVPWTGIVQEPGRWIDAGEAAGAIGAGNRVAMAVELRSEVERVGWAAAGAREWRVVELALASTAAENRRFAVFSLGPIPLAVQLGFLLGDRARVALFQFDRDRGTWAWDAEAAAGEAVSWAVSECEEGPRDEAAVRVSLSAEARPEAGLRAGVEVDVRVAAPSVRWLRRPEQLTELARVYGEALAAIRSLGVRRVHLYYAGPAAGAVQFGRAYNARMNPPLEVYEYRRGESPSYARAVGVNR